MKLTRPGTCFTPLRNVGSITRKFHNPIIPIGGMSVTDKNVAVWRHEYVIRLVECLFGASRNTCSAKAHQHFTLWAEFDDLVSTVSLATGIGHPHIPLIIHVNSVGPHEHPSTKSRKKVTVFIKLKDRIQIIVTHTGVLAAPVKSPDGFTIR